MYGLSILIVSMEVTILDIFSMSHSRFFPLRDRRATHKAGFNVDGLSDLLSSYYVPDPGITLFNSPNNPMSDVIILNSLQMGKPKQRKVKQLAQDRSASSWQRRALHPHPRSATAVPTPQRRLHTVTQLLREFQAPWKSKKLPDTQVGRALLNSPQGYS